MSGDGEAGPGKQRTKNGDEPDSGAGGPIRTRPYTLSGSPSEREREHFEGVQVRTGQDTSHLHVANNNKRNVDINNAFYEKKTVCKRYIHELASDTMPYYKHALVRA